MQAVYIIFSDLSKFSKLSAQGQLLYLNIYEKKLAPQLLPYLENSIYYNTWGDAIIAVFNKPNEAISYMLAYRKLALKYCTNLQGSRVLPRIAGHYGQANIYYDPLLKKYNVISDAVNIAARIEPVTRPGEIFVSKAFMEQSLSDCPSLITDIRLDQIGFVTLPKNQGELEIFRLASIEESAHILDEVFYNSIDVLNNSMEMTMYEQDILARNVNTTSLEWIKEIESASFTLPFCLKIAEIYKENGCYEEALQWIERIDAIKLPDFNHFDKPFSTLQRVVRLKSDILTKLGAYKQSSEILLNLKNHLDGANVAHQSEITARLAGQLKRLVFTDEQCVKERASMADSEIQFIADLYIYAFKLNIENYYPAINAAYLLTLLDEEQKMKGHKLASYIRQTWYPTNGSDIWQDMTLIETAIVLGEYDRAYEELKMYLFTYQVDQFSIQTIYEHLKQYFSLLPDPQVGKRILHLLCTYRRKE